jgi:two-component system, OmpR family, sensor histidine kinase KdpD
MNGAPDQAKSAPAWLSSATALALFSATTLLAYMAQTYNRPISATLIYLLGVLLIGAGWGLRLGLIAAISASVIYNFFLSEPVLRFTVSSLDEIVPLIAFNLTAICSGVLAGRLNDRARVAEKASRELNLLLQLGNQLQQAIDLKGVGSALAEVIGRFGLGSAEVFVTIDGALCSASPTSTFQARAAAAFADDHWGDGDTVSVQPLISSGEVFGVLIHSPPDSRQKVQVDWGAVASLLTIAIERALFFQSAAEREALKRSEEFKTTLLASVSHDLRTPLAAMTASASSLRSFGEQLLPDERRKMLSVIQEQCARLDRYTSNLLSLAKLENEQIEDGAEIADLADLLGAALAAFRTAYPDHSVSKALATGPALVRGNSALIEQVFFNVLENAGRYSAPGSIVGVRLFERGGEVVVSIEDEGRGIAAHELERVFARFYRSPATADVVGQGLGLSIARGIAERFGGSVRAHSPARERGGTRIDIRFPIAEAAR